MKHLTNELRNKLVSHKTRFIILLSVLLIICTAGMTGAAFADLQISQNLSNPQQSFSKFMGDFGQWPAYAIIIGFFAALLVWCVKAKKYFLCAFLLFTAIVLFYFVAVKWFSLMDIPKLFSNALFNIISIAAVIAVFFVIPRSIFEKLFLLLILAFLIFTVTHLAMAVFKVFWGRVRFHDLADNFTPWYKPNGINGNYSFFSGHVATACCLLILWLVPYVFKIKNRIICAAIFILPVLYILAMAYARIVTGAHYLSDTVFAIVNFALWTALSAYILCRNRNKKPRQIT